MRVRHGLFLLVSMSIIIGLLGGGCELLYLDFGLARERAVGCPQVEIQSSDGAKTFATWVLSEAAPDRGIVVRVIYPDRPRYPEGTAAVVEVPGGDSPGGVELPPQALGEIPLIEQGLVQVKFAFPGGGRLPLRSGGVYDHRGINSLKALRDVVRFLRGELGEQNGCSIDDLLPYAITQLGSSAPPTAGIRRSWAWGSSARRWM
jgi:hypothetical protein